MADVTISRPPRERADIVRPARLQGFSDAVFATAATLLVIPIRKFELESGETLKEALIKRYPQLIVFVLGFLVICAIWESHIIRFKLISKVDDVIVVLTLVSLMLTTFLPFSVELEGYYGKYVTPTVLNCFMLLALELLELAMFIYAFHTPKLLTRSLRELEVSELKARQKQIYVKIAYNCGLFIGAAIFSLASVVVSWVLITTVIATPYLRKLLSRCSTWFTCCPHTSSTSYDVLSGRTEKERIECFSDAAIAIVATLLILDLTTEEFPKPETVEEKGIEKTLNDMWQNFVAYMGTYSTVAIMWFVHHSVLHHIKMFTVVMVIFNNIFLAFLAGTPFVSTLVNKFTGQSSHNERIAVRVSCVIVFMSSLSNCAIYLSALWQKDITLYPWAVPHSDLNRTTRSHIYLILKTLIIPSVTIITFLSSLTTDMVTFVVYHTALVLVPVLFIILKVAYACHCWQNPGGYHDEISSISGSSAGMEYEQPESPREDVALREPSQPDDTPSNPDDSNGAHIAIVNDS